MFWRFAVVAVLVAVVHTSPTVRAQQSALTQADVDAAIAWGKAGDAVPYLLHHMPASGTSKNPVVLGVVYTPFVRVALAAKRAYEAHRDFTVEDVTPAMVEPVVYIAFRWYSDDVDYGNSSRPLPSNCRVAVPGNFVLRGHSGVEVTASPVWVRPDVSLLNEFGAVPYKDIVLVAAYPVAALTSGTDFVIYRERQGENGLPGYEVRIGRIRPDERTAWR